VDAHLEEAVRLEEEVDLVVVLVEAAVVVVRVFLVVRYFSFD
jgi:hypothetical protein